MTTPAKDPLCSGAHLGYKAFKRRVDPTSTPGAIILLASCQFGTSGWSIYFEPDGENKFELFQKEPQGIVTELVTLYSALWSEGYELADPPATVSITDTFGTHSVPVEDWPA